LPEITTLIRDIYQLFDKPHPPKPQNIQAFAEDVAQIMSERMSEQRQGGYLRPSNLGQPCERKLWYSVNSPEDAELLSSKVRFKFLYGDLIEALVLFLAREAGHKVEGCHDEVEIDGVKGKRDAIIDGVLTDVKSANTRAFDKFENHTLKEDDPFGYVKQLGFYREASQADERVIVKDKAAFLAVDKELGSLVLDIHHKDPEEDWETLIAQKREMLAHSEPPDRAFEDVPEGKSGNRRLKVPCTYCEFKKKCWPGLRVFMYSNGPMFLTNVGKEPKPMEITDAQRVAA
jgi:hypothetical protein